MEPQQQTITFYLSEKDYEFGKIELPLIYLPPIGSEFIFDILENENPLLFNELNNTEEFLLCRNSILDNNDKIIGYRLLMYVYYYEYRYTSNHNTRKSMFEDNTFRIWLNEFPKNTILNP